MANKFKPGDKVRIKVLDKYRWGKAHVQMLDAIESRAVCTVSTKTYPEGVYLDEVGHEWVIHQDEIESATRKPTIIFME